jgi:hypothetical protein
MKGAIPPLLQYAFMAWYLVKHRDNFTFTFTELLKYVSVYVNVFVFLVAYTTG